MILFLSVIPSTLPALRCPIGIAHTRSRSQAQPHDQSPGIGTEEVRIDDPTDPSPDDQRSEQFRPNPDSLSEPRI